MGKGKILFLSVLVSFFVNGLLMAQNQTLDERIKNIMDQMSDQEKINQLINSGFGSTPANNRLGIPGFEMSDGPHGVRFNDNTGRKATAFPTGMAMVSTWDEDIARRVGDAMGTEFWAFAFNVALGPCIDQSRDPRGGRNAESGGEDPYLTAHINTNMTKGIQGTYPVIASVKHYLGESRQTLGSDQYYRHSAKYTASERWLMDFLSYNFRTVMQEAGTLGIMDSYNWFNGFKLSTNTELLQTMMRDRWGYPFFIVSDWGNIDQYTSKDAIIAGTDVCMGDGSYTGKNWKAYEWELPDVIKTPEGKAAIDAAVYRVLKTKIIDGMLDRNLPASKSSNANTPEIQATSREAACKSLILLKNRDNILPLNKNIKVAVIGPNAAEENLNCSGSSATNPPYAISALKGIQDKIGSGNVVYSKGCNRNDTDVSGFAAAKETAKNADVVIFVGGLSHNEEGEGFAEGWDRSTINLPGKQQDLINELAAVNPNVVVVIQSGGVCSVHDAINSIKGFVYSFYAGQEAGAAIADVLFGDYNPAGRMAVTMAQTESQLPPWNESWDDDFGTGYRWFDEMGYTPEFAFGFGLSYTTFAYSNITAPDAVEAGQPFVVTADVKNTGNLDGEEVVQLYMSAPGNATVWMPKKELRGFKRIALKAGETKTVTFNLVADDFYYWNTVSKHYDILPGNYTFKVGGSSDNLPLSKIVSFNDGAKKADLKITQIYTMPRYPQQGENVRFYALVKNQGNDAVYYDTYGFGIDFSIDGNVVASADAKEYIAPGQVKLIESSGVWAAQGTGKYTVAGQIKNKNMVVEWDENNNTFERILDVLPPAPVNLALHKPVEYTGGIQDNSADLAASNITDGILSSRWASPYGQDNKVLTIDLEEISQISEINILWEAAYASAFTVELSIDKANWTQVYSGPGAVGGQSIPVNNIPARFVKINCISRVTQWGFSIYEVMVYGNNETAIKEVDPVQQGITWVDKKLIISGENHGISVVKIYNVFGKLVSSYSIPKDTFIVDLGNWTHGVYFVQSLGKNKEIVQKIII